MASRIGASSLARGKNGSKATDFWKSTLDKMAADADESAGSSFADAASDPGIPENDLNLSFKRSSLSQKVVTSQRPTTLPKPEILVASTNTSIASSPHISQQPPPIRGSVTNAKAVARVVPPTATTKASRESLGVGSASKAAQDSLTHKPRSPTSTQLPPRGSSSNTTTGGREKTSTKSTSSRPSQPVGRAIPSSETLRSTFSSKQQGRQSYLSDAHDRSFDSLGTVDSLWSASVSETASEYSDAPVVEKSEEMAKPRDSKPATKRTSKPNLKPSQPATRAIPSSEALRSVVASKQKGRQSYLSDAHDRSFDSVGTVDSLWSSGIPDSGSNWSGEESEEYEGENAIQSDQKSTVAKGVPASKSASSQSAARPKPSQPVTRHIPSSEALRSAVAAKQRGRQSYLSDAADRSFESIGTVDSLWSTGVPESGSEYSEGSAMEDGKTSKPRKSTKSTPTSPPGLGLPKADSRAIPSSEALRGVLAARQTGRKSYVSEGNDRSFDSVGTVDSLWSTTISTSKDDSTPDFPYDSEEYRRRMNNEDAAYKDRYDGPEDSDSILGAGEGNTSASYDQTRFSGAGSWMGPNTPSAAHMGDDRPSFPGTPAGSRFGTEGRSHGASTATSPRKATFLMPTAVPSQPRGRVPPGPQYVFEELKSPNLNGRKLRKRVKPLDFYRNEKLVYGYRDTSSKLPSILGVIRNVGEDVTSAGMPVQKRFKRGDDEEEIEASATMQVYDEFEAEPVERVIAIPTPSFKPIVDGEPSTLISDAFGCVTGWIKLAYGAEQVFNPDPDQTKVFFMAKGQAILSIGNQQTKIPQFGSFMVPPNNAFSLRHSKNQKVPCLLSFVALSGDQRPSSEYTE